MLKTSLVILGAGVAGLAAAAEAERNKIDYFLLEANQMIGGLSRSIYISDYIFDYTGHLLHLNTFKSPEDIGRHFNNNDWIRINRSAKCMYKDILIDAPFQYNINQLPESLYQKHLMSYMDAKCDNAKKMPVSMKNYFYQHYGKEISDEFLIPYNEKQFAISMDELSGESISKFFPVPKDEYVLNGIEQSDGALYNSQFWYPKSNGIQLLIDCLAQEVDIKRAKLNCPVLEIDFASKIITTNNEKISYEYLVSSIPLNNFIKIITPSVKLVHELNSGLSACNTLVYHIGVNSRIPTRFEGVNWIYFSEPKYPFYRVGFYSSFNEVMARENKYSIYIEIGSNELNPNNTNTTSVIDSLHSLGILEPSDIEIIASQVIHNSYVHYNYSRSNSLKSISSCLDGKDIQLIGRYGRWQYSSMEDSIIEGKDAIQSIIEKV